MKEFKKKGVPWTYEEPVMYKKVHKYAEARPENERWKKKAIKVEKIKNMMENLDEMTLEYRQQMMNKKKFKGFEKVA